MTTTYETFRDAIHGVLDGVAGIGNVHKQKRWSADPETFNTAYKATVGGVDQIRAWWISRASTPAALPMTKRSTQRDYVFELEGFMGLDDSADTEQTFQTLVDTVMDALDAERPGLGGADHQEPVILELYDEVMLSEYLCHYARLRLTLVKFSN